MKKKSYVTMAAAQAAENLETNKTWSDTFDEGYIHQFQPKPT